MHEYKGLLLKEAWVGTDSQSIRKNKKKVPAGEVDRKWERDGLTKVYFQYYFKWAPKGQGCICQGLIKKKKRWHSNWGMVKKRRGKGLCLGSDQERLPLRDAKQEGSVGLCHSRDVWTREKGLSQSWHTNYGPEWQAGWWGCPQWSKRGVAGKTWCGEDYKVCLIHIESELTDSHLQETSGKQDQISVGQRRQVVSTGGSATGCTVVVPVFIFASEITHIYGKVKKEDAKRARFHAITTENKTAGDMHQNEVRAINTQGF